MSRDIPKDRLAGLVRPGDRLYLPGGVGIPVPFIEEISREPECSRGLRILTSIAPGIENPLRMDRLHPTATVTGLFMQPELAEAQREGRYRALPMSYGGFVRHLRDMAELDLAIIQVTPPDAEGRCSLGPSVEFTPLAVSRSRRVLALVDPDLPRLPGAVTLPWDRFDHICEVGRPLPEYGSGTDPATQAIAVHIARFVEDGSTLQAGLGKVPTALMPMLRDRRGLRLHSGLLSDGLMVLEAAGALDSDFMHACCVLAGSARLYDWARSYPRLKVVGCDITHDARVLSGLDRFVAVNSALEVDLFGQCNLENAGSRAVSGAGGAPDFARAARLSPGGCSIVALNASYREGSVSRIVPELKGPAVASLPRVDVDCVITEFGVADLRGASVHERAKAIIAVAAPGFRQGLEAAWQRIAASL